MATLPPLATLDAFKAWPSVTVLEDEEVAAGAVLAAASARVRGEAGKTWLNADGTAVVDVPDEVADIVVQVAARVWLNPEGYSSETIGAYTWRRGDGEYAGIFLTDDERDRIGRIRSSTRRGLRTIATTRAEYGTTGYVPVVGTETEFPWYAEEA